MWASGGSAALGKAWPAWEASEPEPHDQGPSALGDLPALFLFLPCLGGGSGRSRGWKPSDAALAAAPAAPCWPVQECCAPGSARCDPVPLPPQHLLHKPSPPRPQLQGLVPYLAENIGKDLVRVMAITVRSLLPFLLLGKTSLPAAEPTRPPGYRARNLWGTKHKAPEVLSLSVSSASVSLLHEIIASYKNMLLFAFEVLIPPPPPRSPPGTSQSICFPGHRHSLRFLSSPSVLSQSDYFSPQFYQNAS